MERESILLIFVIIGVFAFIGFAALQSGFIETELSGVLLADGSVPLTANWNAGAFNITAEGLTLGTDPYIFPVNDSTPYRFLMTDGEGQLSFEEIPLVGEFEFFVYNEASDIATYLIMNTSVPTQAKESLTTLDVANDELLQVWATEPTYPGITVLPEGISSLHIHGYSAVTGNAVGQIYYEMYVRYTDTTEVLLATSEPSDILIDTSRALTIHSNIADPTALNGTDRIILKVYAVKTGVGSLDITLEVEGDTTSHFAFPSQVISASGFVPYIGATQDLNLGANNLLLSGSSKVQFRDAAIYLASLNDGYLDIAADTQVRVNAPVIFNEDIEVLIQKMMIVTTTFARNKIDTSYIGLQGSTDFQQAGFVKIGGTDQGYALDIYWDNTRIARFSDTSALNVLGQGIFANAQVVLTSGSDGGLINLEALDNTSWFIDNYNGTLRFIDDPFADVVLTLDQAGNIVLDGTATFIENRFTVSFVAGQGATITMLGSDSTVMYQQNYDGTMRWIDNGYAFVLMTLDQSGNLGTYGTITAPNVDTGQGAYELYAMNQDVETTDAPTFAGLSLSDALTFTGSGIIYGVDTSTNLFMDAAGDFVVRDTDLGTTNIIWYDKSETDLFLGTTAIDTKFRGNAYLQSYLLNKDGTGKFLESTYTSYSTVELFRESDGDIGFYDRTNSTWLIRHDMATSETTFPEDVIMDGLRLVDSRYKLTSDYRFGSNVLGILNTGTNEDARIGLNPSGTADASGFYLYNSGSSTDVGRINFILTGDTLTMSAQSFLTGTLPTEFRVSGLKLGFAAGEYIEITDTNHLDLYADTSIDFNAHADATYMMGVLTTGSQTGVSGGTTRYLSFSISNVAFAAENEAEIQVKQCNIRNLRVIVYTNTCTASSTITLRKNNADTILSVTVGATDTGEYADITDSIAFATGDNPCIEVTAGGTGSIVVTAVLVETY